MNEAEKKSFAPDDLPLVCEGLDLMSLNVTPEEGFLLSRLDGTTSVGVLFRSTGLGEEKTATLLASLMAKNIVIMKGVTYCQDRPGPENGDGHEAASPEAGEDTDEFDDDEAAGEEEGEDNGLSEGENSQVLRKLKMALRKKQLPKGPELLAIVEQTFVNLENLSYYDLLGVPVASEFKEIKKSYLRRTKSFHPDRFYRNADKQLVKHVQEIFKQLNKGYKVLADAEKRGEYDKSLDEEEMWLKHELADEEETITTSRTRSVKGDSSPWKRIRVSRQKPIEEKTRKKKKKEEKPKVEGPKLKLGLKDGKSASPLLKKIHEMKEKEQKTYDEQAERFYRGAMVEKDSGNINAARNNLKLALQYSPGNKKYLGAVEELEHFESSRRAETSFKSGMKAHDAGDLKQALKDYREAIRLGYENSLLYNKMAELIMELEGNYELARSLSLKAIEKQPEAVDFRMTLARAYKGLGQKAAAMVQFNKVLEIQPKNKLAIKELKALKRG